MSESNTQTSLSYEEYYQRVINSQLQSDNFAGLKLVVGPTGMGKTSAIPRVIAELREKNSGKRCIYTSHRHLLIEQMESALSEVNIPSVYLRNNEEVVRAFIADNRRDDFLEKLEGSNFFDYADVPLRETRRLIGDVTKLFQSLNQLSKTEFVAAAMIQERLRRRCSELMKIFKNGLGNIAKETREELLSTDSPFWVLFPYTQFLYDPQKPVLLVTIHKLLYGFFAGHRDEGILSLSDNIIFLDEFDMQETEILSFLCRDNEIRNSFEFVRLFYEEMRDQQKLGNLTVFDDDLKAQQTAKREAVRIIQGLEKACQDNGFRFPQVSRFFLSEGEFAREALSVFQSNVLILTTPFSLLDKGLYWQIVSEKSSETLSARQLFSLIFRKAEAILEFFTILWANDLTAEWRSWIEQCYDRKNDNVAGRYQEVIREYGVFKRPIKLPKNVKDESVKESIYYKGFNFFRLRRGAYPALPDEVKIDQKTLTVSPEYILWRVCRSNLVFGLSATGDIKRYISSFDMRWLEEHCNYLVVDDEDKKLVSELKRCKETARNYDIRFDEANLLPARHPLSRALDDLDRVSQFFTVGDEGYSEEKSKYRKKTVSLFLESLRWITRESDNQSHLIFLNSFRYIKKLFDQENLPPHFYEYLQSHLDIHKGERPQEYQVTIEGKECYVILLDSRKGRMVEDELFIQNDEDVPLIVVTPYKTSSNGVNLKWATQRAYEEAAGRSEVGRDFEGIHLLEAPHFYFSDKQDNDDDVDGTKMFIWQIWKLYANHEISRIQFEQALQDLNIPRTNDAYKRTQDYLLNQIALFYQAIGRVDRQWRPMPVMDIRLAQDVVAIFERYLTAKGIIGRERIEREAYTSSLILKLHAEIRDRYLDKMVWNELEHEDIGELEDRSKATIGKLLRVSGSVRNEEYSTEDARKVMMLWWVVREAVLSQDYQFRRKVEIYNGRTGQNEIISIDFPSDFVHATAFLQEQHQLYLDWQQRKICPHQTPDTTVYDLNKFYRNFEQNRTIRHYFQRHNYKLEYHPSNQNYYFTPYILQSVLAGAVGEAALIALLQEAGITLELEKDCPSSLFEVFDLKVAGLPVYIDAKNFSWVTLNRFAAKPGDPEFDEDLNSEAFLEAAQRKWHYIVEKTGNHDTKLVFINLMADDYRPNESWGSNLKRVDSYAAGAITVIQGAIRSDNPDELRDDFQSWLNQVKEQLNQLKEQTHAI